MSIYLATFGKLRYLGLAEIADEELAESRWVLLRTVRGLEMGRLGGPLSQEQEAKYRASCLGENGEQARGPEPMLQEVEFVANAGPEDMENYRRCRSDEERALVRAREILLEQDGLQMKLVDVEYMLDRRKLFFYFTSEQRVDFRAYVRDLARDFHTRIEMRQIGVRDEARVVKGIGPCGRPCCCSYWLHDFTPICIRMVKEQKLALNPTKISGICGRLMCCMAYEHETYGALWKGLPGPGSKIRTENGTYVLESVDLATERVQVRTPSGRVAAVPVADFQDFRAAVLRGEEWGDEEALPRPAGAGRRFPAGGRRSDPAPARGGDGRRRDVPPVSEERRTGRREQEARPGAAERTPRGEMEGAPRRRGGRPPRRQDGERPPRSRQDGPAPVPNAVEGTRRGEGERPPRPRQDGPAPAPNAAAEGARHGEEERRPRPRRRPDRPRRPRGPRSSGPDGAQGKEEV